MALHGRSREADMTLGLTCRDVIELLADYLEQSLSPETLEGIEGHLDQCAACVAYVHTYKKTRELTGEVTRVAMPEDMRARVRRSLLDRLGGPPGREV
jgi:anti-sigma factor RsiW